MVPRPLTRPDQPFYGKEQRKQNNNNHCPYNSIIPSVLRPGAMRNTPQYFWLLFFANRAGKTNKCRQYGNNTQYYFFHLTLLKNYQRIFSLRPHIKYQYFVKRENR